jgi:hypothetical protein
MAIEKTAGFFAREVLKRFSELPIEDELRLNNARIRDHFLTGIFTLAAFREVEEKGVREDLATFHAANKFLLMACHQQLFREMGVRWGGLLHPGQRRSRRNSFSTTAICSVQLSRKLPATPTTSMSFSMRWVISAIGFQLKKKPTASD